MGNGTMRVAYAIYSLRRTYAYLRLTRTTITSTIMVTVVQTLSRQYLTVQLYTELVTFFLMLQKRTPVLE